MPSPPPKKLKTFLDYVNQNKAHALSPEIAHQHMGFLSSLSIPAAPMETVTDRTIDNQGHPVPVRHYQPHHSSSERVMIFLHGGGHMCGSIALYESTLTALSQHCHTDIYSVEYRLTPEHPYPTGYTDCLAVIDVLKKEYQKKKALYLAGDSAGGNLVATICQRDACGIAGQILIYPSVDFSCHLPSHQRYKKGYLLEKRAIDFYFNHYLPPHLDRQSPDVSPLFSNDFSAQPPTFIALAELDPLHDEGMAYANQLIEANVATTHTCFPGMVHAFMMMHQIVPKQVEHLFEQIHVFLTKATT